MVKNQGVYLFNICYFLAVFSRLFHLFIYLLKKGFCFIFLANIQDALFFKKGKTRECFCGVFSVVSFILLFL